MTPPLQSSVKRNGKLWDLAMKVAVPLVGLLCATVVAHEVRLAVIESGESTFEKQYKADIIDIKETLKRIEDRVHDIEVG